MSLVLVEDPKKHWFSEAPNFKEDYSFFNTFKGIQEYLTLIPQLVASRTVVVVANEPLFKRANAKINELSSLPDDWDSYGARPVPRIAIDMARRFLDLLERRERLSELDSAAPFSLVPIPRGGVQIEWRRRGKALEVEIGPEGKISFVLDEGTAIRDRFTEKNSATAVEALDALDALLTR
jgi:hypothetical protein